MMIYDAGKRTKIKIDRYFRDKNDLKLIYNCVFMSKLFNNYFFEYLLVNLIIYMEYFNKCKISIIGLGARGLVRDISRV